MQFKTSWFNPSLAKNQLRRFWPLPVCAALGFLLALVLPYYTQLRELSYGTASVSTAPFQGSTASEAASFLSSQYYLLCLLLAGAALAAAMLLFHHLHSRREIQFYLGLPVARGGLFCTSAVMGFLLIALPLLLADLAILVTSLAFGLEAQVSLRFLAASLLAYLCFYGMALVACVMAGQSFGAFLLCCGMHCAAGVILLGACQVGGCFIPGFSGHVSGRNPILWLTPLVQLMQVGELTRNVAAGAPDASTLSSKGLALSTPLIYGLVGLGLILLAAVLYQRRRAETAGEMISFSGIRWLSKVLAAMAVGLGGTLLLLLLLPYHSQLSFGILLAMVLVITALGWIAAEMVIRKSFRVFMPQSVIPCGALLLCIAALMVGIHGDMTGYVHRIPDLADIDSASISVSYGGDNYVSVSPEDARSVHEILLSHLDQLHFTTEGDNAMVSVSYGLSGGKTMERTYYLSTGDQELAAQLNAILDKPENVYSALFPYWPQDPDSLVFRDSYVSIEPSYEYVTQDAFAAAWSSYPLTGQQAQTLYHAICQDIEAGRVLSPNHPYLSADSTGDPLGYLDLYLWEPGKDDSRWQANITLREAMTSTIAALKEMGLL